MNLYYVFTTRRTRNIYTPCSVTDNTFFPTQIEISYESLSDFVETRSVFTASIPFAACIATDEQFGFYKSISIKRLEKKKKKF